MLVIVLVMGLLNFLNYREAIQSADNILDILAENDGSFPPPRQPEDMEIREAPQEENTESTSEGASGETSEESPQEAPEGRREIFHGRGWLSPETPYETRFFVVSLNEDGEILSTDTGKIAAVDEETAKDYAEKIWDSQRTQGFVSQYRYRLQETDEGFLAIFLGLQQEPSGMPQRPSYQRRRLNTGDSSGLWAGLFLLRHGNEACV